MAILKSLKAVAALALFLPGVAQAYVGDSFLSLPDVKGHWSGKAHKGWIRAEANEWPGRDTITRRGSSGGGGENRLFFGGPSAPKPGEPGQLIVTINKSNPDLALMMARCTNKAPIPRLGYAELTDRSRPGAELGKRPAEFTDFWEYKLNTVVVSACPVVDGAMEQAFILDFQDIEWLNFDPRRPDGTKIVLAPGDIPDIQPAAAVPGKQVKSWVITWIAPATDGAEDQCPAFNRKPTEVEVYRYMAPEDVAKAKAKNGEKGFTYGLETEHRGPMGLNAALLPGIVPDPVLKEAQTRFAFGMDLDGDDGKGPPPKGIRKHKNYTSPDGTRTGIDNQYQTALGCIEGFRGKKGYFNQTPNARRADGNVTTIIEVSGIDDEKNDNAVEVRWVFSKDKPIRDIAGSKFINHYTFRPSENPNFTLYNALLRGRIVNGAIETDAVPKFQLQPGQGPLVDLFNAKMRLEPQPDGTLRAFLAGYRDWREALPISGYNEGLFNYQGPALYYAFKRLADGMKNPVTGEYDGISMSYEIDAVPAYLTSARPGAAIAQANTGTLRAK